MPNKTLSVIVGISVFVLAQAFVLILYISGGGVLEPCKELQRTIAETFPFTLSLGLLSFFFSETT